MKRPRQTRRALLAALCLIPVVAVAAWQFIPPGRDQFATAQAELRVTLERMESGRVVTERTTV